jgi:hypothetical protein
LAYLRHFSTLSQIIGNTFLVSTSLKKCQHIEGFKNSLDLFVPFLKSKLLGNLFIPKKDPFSKTGSSQLISAKTPTEVAFFGRPRKDLAACR